MYYIGHNVLANLFTVCMMTIIPLGWSNIAVILCVQKERDIIGTVQRFTAQDTSIFKYCIKFFILFFAFKTFTVYV